jgi:hypothetical protein
MGEMAHKKITILDLTEEEHKKKLNSLLLRVKILRFFVSKVSTVLIVVFLYGVRNFHFKNRYPWLV